MSVLIQLGLLIYPAISILVYFPCFRGPLIFDAHLLWENLAELKTVRSLAAAWRPVTMGTYWANREWPGTLRGLHVTDALIHAAGGLVVERITDILYKDALAAFLAGLVFVVHPFAANTVAYIGARGSSLSAVLGLASAGAVLSGSGWLAFLLLALAVLAKEDGVGFLALAIVLAGMTGQLVLAVSLILAGTAGVVYGRRRIAAQFRGNGDTQMEGIGLPVSHKQPFHGWTVLVETLLRLPRWAVGLGQCPYPGSGVPVPGRVRSQGAGLVFASIVTAFFVVPDLRVPIIFLMVGPWLVYLVCPLPDQMMEYRNYSMTAGFALVFASLSIRIENPAVSAILVAASLAAMAVSTAEKASNWSDTVTMWTVSGENAYGDRSRAWQEAGAWLYAMDKNFPQAETCFRKAIELNPRLAPALENLARLSVVTGRFEESIGWMEQALRFHPDYPPILKLLPELYEKTGRFEEADRMFARSGAEQAAIRANTLGMLTYHDGNLDRAGMWFDRAMAAAAGVPDYIYNRAMVWKKSGNNDAAMRVLSVLTPPLNLTPAMIRPENT